jgi:hypothetical protein
LWFDANGGAAGQDIAVAQFVNNYIPEKAAIFLV